MEPLYCEICDHEHPDCRHAGTHRVEIHGLGGTFVVCMVCRDALRRAGKLRSAQRLQWVSHIPAEVPPLPPALKEAMAERRAKRRRFPRLMWPFKLSLWFFVSIVLVRTAMPAPTVMDWYKPAEPSVSIHAGVRR